MEGKKRYVVEMEKAREGVDGRPSVGAVYRNVLAQNGFKPLPQHLHSCWDIFWETDICTIMYTSGTTGDPKGVLISNESILSIIAGVNHHMEDMNEEVKEGLGGNLRLILSGAAPLSSTVETFLRVVTGAHVLQGYGLTETCAGSFVSRPDDLSMVGTVGPPLPVVDVCLESVPEMGYDALGSTPRGEICIRGKCLFSGYYKREDLTAEVMVNGWFHTGDIGEWQADGSLKIIDRKKNIFKLSQGEYISVENLESIYSLASSVDSIWVYGNSFESFLVAVVNPNKECIEMWAEGNGVAGDFKSICENPKTNAYILGELSKIAKEKKLKGFEFVKAVYLDPIPFDMERNLLTPTIKKKRAQFFKYYQYVTFDLQNAINGMYKSTR
nr:long chain acyl-CoA synthetase 4-like [Ipomoea batatas]